ncbi:MAG: ABC transporter ATP-binding protein [Planctomycetota bacterium]|nr:MAG: ABC transporter ATP-binding protein [Planctomycetota bacterium]
MVRGVGLSLRGLGRAFPGGVRALEGVHFAVEPGEFVALLGPSGCGKSTLLRLVAGLDRPTAGELAWSEPPGDGALAYVFQDPHLLPWRSVLRNVALPLELRGVARREREATARAALAEVDLADWAGAYPTELSGGMRMRASLARALVTRPRLLLLDEPFAALDELTRLRLDERLRALWREQRPTVLFVTHSISEAVFLAERALVLSPRPARVVADVAVDLPPERDRRIRVTPAFGEHAARLFDLLEEHGA